VPPRSSLDAAAAGRLPAWAVAMPERRAHIERVAQLVGAWGEALHAPTAERRRGRAAAWLHDALRDAPAEQLRAELPEPFRGWPDPLLHGPAAAERLRAEGVRDEALLRAVAYHTLGHPELDRGGRLLYLADFLEPGRGFDPVLRAALRARMPAALHEVLRQVVAARLGWLLETGRAIRPESLDFWNSLVGQP
jgi:HD superfamily phosphohydrolase YqeK